MTNMILRLKAVRHVIRGEATLNGNLPSDYVRELTARSLADGIMEAVPLKKDDGNFNEVVYSHEVILITPEHFAAINRALQRHMTEDGYKNLMER